MCILTKVHCQFSFVKLIFLSCEKTYSLYRELQVLSTKNKINKLNKKLCNKSIDIHCEFCSINDIFSLHTLYNGLIKRYSLELYFEPKGWMKIGGNSRMMVRNGEKQKQE